MVDLRPTDSSCDPAEHAHPARDAVQDTYSREKDDCLRLEVTTQCNSSCPHCFARAGSEADTDLPAAIAQSVIEEAYEHNYRHFHVTGGEPFLWDALLSTLAHAVKIGYQSLFINSNGTFLSNSMVEALAAYDNLVLSISIDGPQFFHDQIRGTAAFERAIKGIRLALAAGIKVQIFTTVRRSLTPLLARFADDIFQKLPAIQGLTLIQLIKPAGNAQDISRELLDPNEFIDLVKQSAWLNSYGYRVDILNNPLANICAQLLEMPWLPVSHPLYRSGSICVRSDGRLTHSHSSEEHFGKYTPGSLPKILSSPAYTRATDSDDIFCAKCAHFDICRSNRMLRPSEKHRATDNHYPFCRHVLNEFC